MQRMRLGSLATGTVIMIAACLFTVSRPASASIEYPPLVKSYWGVKKLPVSGADGCPLCHTSDPGMLGTANQKFAVTLRGFGLQAMSDGMLKAALDKAKSKMSDSDGDGVSDYQELVVDGTNPNDAKSFVAPLPIETGGSGNEPSNSDAGAPSDTPSDVTSDAAGAGGADSTPPDEALGYCQTTETTVYPTLGHGCSLRASSANDSRSQSSLLLAGVLALGLIRRGARSNQGRRERCGQ